MPNHDLAAWQDDREDALAEAFTRVDAPCNVKIGAGPVMQCRACGRGENGKHAEDCAWMRGEVNP